MKRTYTTIHVLGAIAGLLCILVDVASNGEFVYAQTKTIYDSQFAAVFTVAIATALALTACMAAVRQRAIVTAVMLFAGYVYGTAFSLSATLDRVATGRDAQLSEKFRGDDIWKSTKKKRDHLDYAASRECSRVDPRSGRSRGPRCEAAEREVRVADDLLKKREEQLDSLGVRIAAFLPASVRPSHVSLYQPTLLPVALLVLGQWLTAFGVNGRRVAPEFGIAAAAEHSVEARARRLRQEFQRVHGRDPKPKEIAQALNTTIAVSKRLAKQVA